MLDGFVYAVGGWEGRSRLDSVECYNPHTNLWQFTESYKMAVTSPAVVALDGLLYVTGRKCCCLFLTARVDIFPLLILFLISWKAVQFWRMVTAPTSRRYTTLKAEHGLSWPPCRSLVPAPPLALSRERFMS